MKKTFLLITFGIGILFSTSCKKNFSYNDLSSDQFISYQLNNKNRSYQIFSESLPIDQRKLLVEVAEYYGLQKNNVAIYRDSILLLNSTDMTITVSQFKKINTIHNNLKDVQQQINFGGYPSGGPVRCPTIPKGPSGFSKQVRIAFAFNRFTNIPQDWRNATFDAINNWNNLSNKIVFYLDESLIKGTENAWFMISTYTDASSNTVAYANLNQGNLPGSYIVINEFYNNLAYNIKVNTMMHELGHIIGYRHTDQTDGMFIPGSSTTDMQSIMNSFVQPITNFSNFDIIANNFAYPNLNPPFSSCTCNYSGVN